MRIKPVFNLFTYKEFKDLFKKVYIYTTLSLKGLKLNWSVIQLLSF